MKIYKIVYTPNGPDDQDAEFEEIKKGDMVEDEITSHLAARAQSAEAIPW